MLGLYMLSSGWLFGRYPELRAIELDVSRILAHRFCDDWIELEGIGGSYSA